ncbi:VIT1/CCC1 transporter family protein [Candidatus Woesearchaeota archaeon]|nr:VIT1/CCC1 transporter family protein [Candidatus Woesearchaeota archaeon]MBW3005424.1 VIT1/CCC1 transporter family protein [Candidatus Woesearchaeota archaeon]
MNNLKDVLNIVKEHEIIRRYMIINSFDGALTIFGILMASFIAGIRNPSLIILPSIGAAIAMCVSGIWGAYAAESAEVKKKFKELEKHLLTKLHMSKRYAESQKINLLVGLVDGISPLITSMIIILPFFFANAGLLGVMQAYYYSIALITVVLFLLGMFLGKVAKENMYKNGFKMLFAGILIAVVFYVLVLLHIL